MSRFERELEKLRKEINSASSTPSSANQPSQSSPTSRKNLGEERDEESIPSTGNSQQTQLNTLANAGLIPAPGLANSPLALGPTDVMTGDSDKKGMKGQLDELDLGAPVSTNESRKDR
jgi:hypothetical protein